MFNMKYRYRLGALLGQGCVFVQYKKRFSLLWRPLHTIPFIDGDINVAINSAELMITQLNKRKNNDK